jgi:hypothetical protein
VLERHRRSGAGVPHGVGNSLAAAGGEAQCRERYGRERRKRPVATDRSKDPATTDPGAGRMITDGHGTAAFPGVLLV